MANITAITEQGDTGRNYKWESVTNVDTPIDMVVDSGTYTVTVSGTFNGAAIDIEYGQTSATTVSIDSTNLNFTENKSYNITIGRGYIKPVRTGGGAGTDVTIYLNPIKT